MPEKYLTSIQVHLVNDLVLLLLLLTYFFRIFTLDNPFTIPLIKRYSNYVPVLPFTLLQLVSNQFKNISIDFFIIFFEFAEILCNFMESFD